MSLKVKKIQNKPIIPLVLHKIVSGKTNGWEDVSIDKLEYITNIVGQNWTVLRPNFLKKNARWIITFDDGNISDYEIAFPLLIKKNIRATFFIIADKINCRGRLNKFQLREMHESGMSIGSHSLSHKPFTTLSYKEIVTELYESRRRLEDCLGAPVYSFSFPYGDYNHTMCKLAISEGYKYIFTSMHGSYNSSNCIIPRNSINSKMDILEIERLMFPTFKKKMFWWIEDKTKLSVKSVLGHKTYVKLRNYAIEN